MSTFHHKLSTILESTPDQLKQTLFQKVKQLIGPLPNNVTLTQVHRHATGLTTPQGRWPARHYFAKLQRQHARPIWIGYDDVNILISHHGAYSTWSQAQAALKQAVHHLSTRTISPRTLNKIQTRNWAKQYLDNRWNQTVPGYTFSADDQHTSSHHVDHLYFATPTAPGNPINIKIILAEHHLSLSTPHHYWHLNYQQFRQLIRDLRDFPQLMTFDEPHQGDHPPWHYNERGYAFIEAPQAQTIANDWEALRRILAGTDPIEPTIPAGVIQRCQAHHNTDLDIRVSQLGAWAKQLGLENTQSTRLMAYDDPIAIAVKVNTDYGTANLTITRQPDNAAHIDWVLQHDHRIQGQFVTDDLSPTSLAHHLDLLITDQLSD